MPGLPRSFVGDSEVLAINGEEVENDTDEELLPNSDSKPTHISNERIEGGFTDTEVINASDEDEKVDDGVDALEFVPEIKNEIVNLTEGYKGSEPQLSTSDVDDNVSMYGRHKRNVTATENKFMSVEDKNLDCQVPTDSENMDDSDDERTASDEPDYETVVPDIYLEHGEQVRSAAIKHENLPTRKSRHCSSSSKLKKGKFSSPHEPDEGVTEEEELVNKTNPTPPTNKARVPPVKGRRKKAAKKAVLCKSTKKLKRSPEDVSDYETDSESLVDDKSDDEGFVVGDSTLGYLTDTEDCVASGDELDLKAQPIVKDIAFEFPEPHCEMVRIDERPDIEAEIQQEDTDEEGFEIGEHEDNAPLPKIEYEAIANNVDYTTEAEGTASDVATDNDDDLDFEDDEKRDILFELNTWRRAEDSNILEKLDCESGTESTIGKWKSAVTNVIKTSSTIRSLKMCLPSNFSFDELEDSDGAVDTDEENVNEHGEVIACQLLPSKKNMNDDASFTSNESLQASDNESLDEHYLCGQKENECGLAELRFIETDKGAMNIVIGPDRLNDPNTPEIIDNVPGVLFLEDDDDNATDEEIVNPAEDGVTINVYPSTPLTDLEDFGDERSDICRPGTPIPHDVEYSVLSSPKRERIHIKEDKYGVPQVKIEKMSDDYLAVAPDVERPSTATEDIEITLDEALRIFGLQENEKEAYQDLAENSEITSRLRHKIMRHLSEPGPQHTEGGITEEEEVILRKKRGRKGKRGSKHSQEHHATDEELLSERDSEGALCDQADKTLPVISTDEDTDSENFEVSAMEDILDEEPKYPLETPEIIRRAAVKRTEIYKEGPNRTTGNVIIEPALARCVPQEFLTPLTDTEELEASAAEDIYEPCAEGDVALEGERIKITQSEEMASVAQDHPAIKENLLYSNINAYTDVESLDGVEGHRFDLLS